jgi:hypothetical protein
MQDRRIASHCANQAPDLPPIGKVNGWDGVVPPEPELDDLLPLQQVFEAAGPESAGWRRRRRRRAPLHAGIGNRPATATSIPKQMLHPAGNK